MLWCPGLWRAVRNKKKAGRRRHGGEGRGAPFMGVKATEAVPEMALLRITDAAPPPRFFCLASSLCVRDQGEEGGGRR